MTFRAPAPAPSHAWRMLWRHVYEIRRAQSKLSEEWRCLVRITAHNGCRGNHRSTSRLCVILYVPVMCRLLQTIHPPRMTSHLQLDAPCGAQICHTHSLTTHTQALCVMLCAITRHGSGTKYMMFNFVVSFGLPWIDPHDWLTHCIYSPQKTSTKWHRYRPTEIGRQWGTKWLSVGPVSYIRISLCYFCFQWQGICCLQIYNRLI